MATMLDAVINLKDNFSSTLKQVEKSIGGFSRTASNMGKDIQNVGRNLENMGSKLTATVTAPIIAGIGASVNEFAKLEQSIGGVETLFKDSASTVIRNAETAYKRAGVSANGYMENVTSFSARLLQGLGGDTEKAAKIADMAMVDMSDNANKFGTDIGSVQNAYQGFAKGNFTMLDNLKLGFGGTQEEMARLINESGVMGEEFQATAKNVKDIPFDKMIEAIHKVQSGMGVTGTTAKEAMETVSGSIGMAKASLQDFLGGLGNSDANVEQLAQNMVESFKIAVENIKGVLFTMWDNIPLEGWQKNVIAFMVVAGPIILVMGKLTTRVGGAMRTFGKFAGVVKKLGLKGAILTPGVQVVAVIALLAAGAFLIYKNWDKLKEVFLKVKNSILDFAGISSERIESVKEIFKSLGTTMREKMQEVAEKIAPLKEKFGELFSKLGELFNKIMPILMPIVAFIGGVFIAQIVHAFMTFFNIVMVVVEGVAGHIDAMITIFMGFIDFFVGVFTGDWDMAWEGIKTIFTGFMDMLSNAWEVFVGLITAPVDALIDILDGAFHDKMDGIKKAWEGLKEFFKHPIKGTVSAVKKGAGWVADKVGNNYKGTNNWRGGPTWVHEKGAEIIDLPGGSRVYPHDKSLGMAREQGKQEGRGKTGGVTVTGNIFNVRKEADIDAIATALFRKIEKASLNMA